MKIFQFKYYFVFLLIGFLSTAQKKEDDVLEQLKLEIAKKPDSVIKAAENILQKGNITKKTKIKSLLIIAQACSAKGNSDKSLEYAENAKKNAIDAKDKFLQLSSMSVITKQYYIMQLYDKALKNMDEADQVEAGYSYKDSIRKIRGDNFAYRGLIYKNNLNRDLAINYFHKAISEYKLNPDKKNMNLSIFISKNNMGFCEMLLGKLDESEKTFKSIVDPQNAIEGNNMIGYSYLGLVYVYMLQGQYKDAQTELKTSLSFIGKLRDPFFERIAYEQATLNAISLHDWKGYSDFTKKYYDIDRKIVLQEQSSLDGSVKTLLDEKKSEIAKVKKGYVYQKIIFISIIFLLLILILKNLFFTKKQLEEQNQMIKTLYESNKV